MPKSSFSNKQLWPKEGREHDFRVQGRDKRKQVTFKPNKHGSRPDHHKDWSAALSAHLQDEDVDMGFSSGSGRAHNKKFHKANRGGRKSSPVPNGRRKLLESPGNWYRITMPHGDKYDKNFLLKILIDKVAPLQLWPITWQVSGTSVTFYVDDYKMAEKLSNLDRQIQLPNGFKLLLRVFPGSPNVDMNSSLKEKMKLVMAKRYNVNNKALDLTKFHADPDLQDSFCALFKPIVFSAVLEIIAENIPNLEALNLFDNRISILNFLKKVNKKIPNLKILHMGNNKLREMSQLDSLQGLPIVDLVLDGNPLCDKFKDQSSYISEVRKRFPKCIKLDGIDLPPPIGFDIVEEHHLPSTQQTFLCNAEGSLIVRQFLEQYMQIYDSENREELLEAYHENAIYSLTMAYPYGFGKEKNVPWLNWYATDSRNLLRVQDPERRVKLLKQGRVSVVSFLKDMPQTKHDIHSFTVDLTLFLPQMMTLTVSGMFKELKSGHKIPPLRYFYKTLIIIPVGSGFKIANEEVHITNATPEQGKEAFKTPINIINSPSTSSSPVVAAATVTSPVVPDDTTKQGMVQQLSIHSGMNLEWSLKCLEETHWDFQKAVVVFQNLHSRGAVPAEAFVK